jgi:hypothetical protein
MLIKQPLGKRDVREIKIAEKTGAHGGELTEDEKAKLTFKVTRKLREQKPQQESSPCQPI